MAHWREYPLSHRGWLAVSTTQILGWSMGVVGGGMLAMFGLALAGEQGLLGVGPFARTFDLFARKGLGAVMIVEAVLWLLRTLMQGVRARCVSRALVAAAQAGADRSAVPVSTQMDAAYEPAYREFGVSIIWVSSALGMFTMLGWLVMIQGSSWRDEPLALLGLILITAFIIALLVLRRTLRRRAREAQEAEKAAIGARWTSEDDKAAWKRVTRIGGQADGGAGTVPRLGAVMASLPAITEVPGRRLLVGGNMLLVAGAATVAGVLVIFDLLVALAYPDADRIARRVGER